jgi:phosphoribosyl 1,2-cyclic phosphodiesterase
MGVSVSVLASGSRGNSALVQTSKTKILVDVGISCRETFKRMKVLAEDPRSLSAVLITHEHSDHVYGLLTLAKKLKIPVFMTGATHQCWARSMRDENGVRPQLERFEAFSSGRRFQVGEIEVTPFTIPHDAADPVGFTFRAEGVKVCPGQRARSIARLRCAGHGIESRRGDAPCRSISLVGQATRDEPGWAPVQ